MNITLPIANKSQEELRAAFEKMARASDTVPVEYVENGVKKSTVLNLAEGLEKSLAFWSGQVLPEIPQVFTPNSESHTSPRSKLEDPVNV